MHGPLQLFCCQGDPQLLAHLQYLPQVFTALTRGRGADGEKIVQVVVDELHVSLVQNPLDPVSHCREEFWCRPNTPPPIPRQADGGRRG